MQRDRGLPGPGDALQDEHVGGLVADHGVLLALDRGDDVAHLLVGGLAELALQDLVADVDRALEQVLQLPALDLVLALAGDLALGDPVGRVERRRPGLVVVVQARDRCAPVVYTEVLRLGVPETVHADVVRLRPLDAALPKIDTAEYGESSSRSSRLRELTA